jgi:hypothetical protein
MEELAVELRVRLLHQDLVLQWLQWCYSGVTVLSLLCQSCVTVVFSGVTVVLQWGYIVLQWYYSGYTVM